MDDELIHHGVKGQKWGVRRYQNEDGTLTKAGERRYYDTPNDKREQYQRTSIQNAKQQRKELIKNRRNLSDEELSALIKRLDAEKKLKTLYDEDLRAGQTKVKQIMSETGTKVLSSVLTTSLSVAALYAVGSKLGKTKFDPKDIGAAIVKKAIGDAKKKDDDDDNETKSDDNKKKETKNDDLKKREEDLKKREDALKQKEKEAALKKREEDLKKREEDLKKREEERKKKEKEKK